MPRRLRGLVAVALLSGLAGPAHSQELTPPRLIERTDAAYPPQALEAGREASVLLELRVDAEGAVTEATVVEPAGHGFDESAREAARRFRFEPARQDGEPIAARIRFRYEFRLPSSGAEETDAGASETEAGAASSGEAADADAGSDEAGADDAGADDGDGPDAAGDLDELAAAEASALDAAAEAESSGDAGGLGVSAEVERERGEELRRSAEAVHVVDTRAQAARARDLGDVLAREQGVGLRRAGGIGSRFRFSLNGLQGSQIRFFLDGVPLEMAGFPAGIANVPVGLVERVELYRGVVPLRLGADALGGVVNLVTSDDYYRTGASASYQTGSWGTYRATLRGRWHDEGSGAYARVRAFLDHTDNDYLVDVEVPDERGRLMPATVRRFHDAYTAWGTSLEAGFVRRPWARRLSLRLFATEFDKELQHNVVMTVPYGDVVYGQAIVGGTLRYDQPELLGENTSVNVVTSLSRQQIDFRDTGEWVYDWFGERIRERRVPGEIQSDPSDRSLWQWSFFGRAYARWAPEEEHELRLSVTPRYDTRTGDERLDGGPDVRDPLTAQRDLFRLVSGLSYRLRIFDERLENVFFLKHYLMLADTEEQLPGGDYRERDQEHNRFGLGDGFRFRFADWIWAKVSYELATRLPDPDEIFGNGVLIVANLELQPETSHNVNVALNVDWRDRDLGRWTAELNLFARVTDQQIVLLGNDLFFTYQNVFSARTLGAELALGWTSPGEYVSVNVNGTYQDQRNTSSEGTFGAFEGDRIPNRPWLFANASLTLRWPSALTEDDALSLSWDTRYVHEFFRGWESQGLREFKQTVDSQLVFGLALTYRLPEPVPVSTTFEVQNLTNAAVFDFFGVQRPGRSFFLKLTAEL
ncbi:MAG TPA: TonB-dependent siderophore myxochelin receptor MxcH [Sandaracinaceae bacterium LLY-WYZ-13_1]|nr:TonB-dependent siderophore myxochelin receptor MxcH [Sandaracinaceae bacterium LLY-WYZ-13_1]